MKSIGENPKWKRRILYVVLFYLLIFSICLIGPAYDYTFKFKKNPETPPPGDDSVNNPSDNYTADGSCDSIQDLLKDPACVGKEVTLTASTNDIRQRTSKSGNIYYLFNLADEKGNSIPCFSWNYPTGDTFSGTWDYSQFGSLQLEIKDFSSPEEGLENSI